jgi:hypothetical protein
MKDGTRVGDSSKVKERMQADIALPNHRVVVPHIRHLVQRVRAAVGAEHCLERFKVQPATLESERPSNLVCTGHLEIV